MTSRPRAMVRRSWNFALIATLLLMATLLSGAAPPRTWIHIRETPIDRNHDGILEGLLLEGEASLGWSGHYWMRPELGPLAWMDRKQDATGTTPGMSKIEFDAMMNGRKVVDDSAWVGTTDRKGVARFSYHFAGWDLCGLRVEGPLRFRPNFHPEVGDSPLEPLRATLQPIYTLLAATQPWSWRQFAGGSVYGDSVGWAIDSDSSSVRLWVTLHVLRADSVRVHATAGLGEAYADTAVVCFLRVGERRLETRLWLATRDGHRIDRIRPEKLLIEVRGVDFGWLPQRWQVGPLSPMYIDTGPGYFRDNR